MNPKDLFRRGIAGLAFVGAAASGLIASQSAPQNVGVSVQPPPVLPLATNAEPFDPKADDFELWTKAFVQPQLVAEPEAKPWRFIGVIGDGPGAKAVFVSPERSDQSVLIGAGETLPDGRVAAAIASQHVLFAKKANGAAGSVATSAGPTGSDEVSLMMKYDAAAKQDKSNQDAAAQN